MNISSKHVLAIAAFVAALTLLPLLIAPPAGDIVFQYALIDCFAGQFWQGDFYPRWCEATHYGLGAPVFLFYPPAAFFLTSLLYPLHFLGVATPAIYLLSLWAASIATFYTCWLWLKEITGPERALLASVFFILMPYRMELMMYRSAFAELWCVAWLPLLFYFARRLGMGDTKTWPCLAATAALCLLTHISAAFAGLFACGIYLLIVSKKLRAPKLYFALAMLTAALLAGFYLLPAWFFSQYLNQVSVARLNTVWSNGFIDIARFGWMHAHLFIDMALVLLITFWLLVLTLKKRAQLSDDFLRRECIAWSVVAVLALFMLCDISEPIWRVLDWFSIKAFPWRMQSLFGCALTFLIAVKMQYFTSQKQLKTWKADYGIAVFLFVLMGLFVQSILLSPLPEGGMLQSDDYHSRWTDKDIGNRTAIPALAQSQKNHIVFAPGIGTAAEERWGWRGIAFSAQLKQPATLRLKHFYFPYWRLEIDGTPADAAFYPEPHSGLMMIKAAAGSHRFNLVPDPAAAMGARYRLALFLSLATAGFLLWRKRRLFIS